MAGGTATRQLKGTVKSYTEVPHVILEAMAMDMEKIETRLTARLLRQLYGWHEETWTTNKSELRQLTELSKQGIYDALNAVKARGFFDFEDNAGTLTFKRLPVKRLDSNLEQPSKDLTFESKDLTAVGVDSGVLNKPFKQREEVPEFVPTPEPLFTATTEEEYQPDPQRLKVAVIACCGIMPITMSAIDRSILSDAVDRLVERKQKPSAVGRFKAWFLDEYLKGRTGRKDNPTLKQFLSLWDRFETWEENQSDALSAEAQREANLRYTEEYYRRQEAQEAEEQRIALIDAEKRAARQEAEERQAAERQRQADLEYFRSLMDQTGVPSDDPLRREYEDLDGFTFNKRMLPYFERYVLSQDAASGMGAN